MARCPKCNSRRPITWDLRKAWVWVPWVCPNCGSKLREDAKPRLYGLAGAVTLTLAAMLGAAFTNGPTLVFVVAVGAAWCVAGVVMIKCDRAVVTAEGPFCPRCMYDLSALPEHVNCPECGWPEPSAKE